MSEGKARIGFVGVGTMGQCAHLKNYVVQEDCEVVAIAEIRQETARLVARRYGVEKVYADHRAMLDAERLDAVVASQPFVRHAVLLPELYERVKYVFTEKPLAVMPDAGRALVAVAERSGCTHMVGYHKRSDPATICAKQTIDQWKASGQFGAMRYVRISMPPGYWVANGFVDLINAGDAVPSLETEPKPSDMDDETYDRYVTFVNYYIHQVNLMRHLLGEPYRPVFADAAGKVLVVESDSGVTGVIEMDSFETSIEWHESAVIGFDKGYVRLSLPAPMAMTRAGEVEIYQDPGRAGGPDGPTPMRIFPTMPWVHAMWQQAIHFVKVCRGEMAPPCGAAEAVEDLNVAREAIRLRFGL